MVELDGSRGEGGGQILRSALTLAVLTGKAFKLVHIRAGRPKPGLAAQHLACVRAAAAICRGHYKGGAIGSTVLHFEPNAVTAGEYEFRIGTAGATALVLHTVLLPLALKGAGPSVVTVTGGTHVAHAPTFEYLATTWAGYLHRLGIEAEFTLVRPGFYPRGGGEVRAVVQPCARLRGVTLLDRAELTTAGGLSVAADLPPSVADRQAARLATRLKAEGVESHIPAAAWTNGPSSVAMVLFRQCPVPPVFSALGERGKPAERVADEAADEALAFRAMGCPVDPHAADQIVLPLALAPEASAYRVSAVTRHLLTNIETIRYFLDRDITCDGPEGSPGVVRVAAEGYNAGPDPEAAPA